MRIPFVKMHGAGNDFVMVDDREGPHPWDARLVAAVAPRGTGIGCEGVILVQTSDRADFRMRFFNPDGSEADLCGNGARCVAAFAREIGAAKSDRMTFETRAGDISAELMSPGLVKVGMPDPKDVRRDFADTGVPHAIVAVDDLDAVDVDGEGRRIRFSPEYAPNGANVDFVRYDPPGRISMRTYERGVEAETGACGTGAVAAAVVGVAWRSMRFPVHVSTARGYELAVDGEYDGERFRSVTLAGPVARVYEGFIETANYKTQGGLEK